MGRLFNPQGPLGIFESIIETDGRGPQHAYEATLRLFPREPYAYYPCSWTGDKCTDGCHGSDESDESEDSDESEVSEGIDKSKAGKEGDAESEGDVSEDEDVKEQFEVNTQDYLADV